jgi:hypothetical protein
MDHTSAKGTVLIIDEMSTVSYSLPLLCLQKEDFSKTHSYLFRAPAGARAGAWEKVGEWDAAHGEPSWVVPLDKEGAFLAVNPYTGYQDKGKGSFVALFEKRGDRIEFADLVDIPYGDKEHICRLAERDTAPGSRPGGAGASAKPQATVLCQTEPASLFPDLWIPALVGDYLALGASRPGILWFFDLKTGRCKRDVDLGGVAPGDLDKLGHLDCFLLGAQPDREGRLLVLTRSQAILDQAIAHHSPQGTPEDVREANWKRFKETAEGMTGLRWWSVDPENGRKEARDLAADFPTQAPYARQRHLRFIVGPDGQVRTSLEQTWREVLEGLELGSGPSPAAPAQRGPAAKDGKGKGEDAPRRP